MGRYTIQFSRRAYAQFGKLESSAQRRIGPAIDSLAADPRREGVVRLSAEDELYRLRVGAYRIVFTVEDDRLVVLVVKIGHRRDVYRQK